MNVLAFEANEGREIFRDLYPVPIPVKFWDDSFSLSPQQSYRVECLENDILRLHKVSDNFVISEKSGLETACQNIEWRDDEVAFSIVSDDGDVHVWPTDGKAPFVVASGAIAGSRAVWSPDGTRLTVVRFADNPDFTADVDIAYIDGQPQQMGAKVTAGNEWSARIPWIANDIVCNGIFGLSYSMLEYYDVNTGRYLTGYTRETFWDGTSTGNFASLSPDKHWLVIDRGNYYNSFDLENPKIHYTLLDTHSKEQYLLSENPEFVIEFLDWFQDSLYFLLIARPTDETAQSDPSLPAGLLALDPNTRQFTPLISGVMYAALNPQKYTVFALLPTAEGQLQAALYRISGEPLAAFQPVTAALSYLTPGEGLPIPAAWSHDGAQVVFGDEWGAVWLADASGGLTQLAANLGFDPAYPRQPQFHWSPDDTHLLIVFDDRAWVLAMLE
ncbi:MAG: hypothetical protein GY803_09960 [Chloroflexi bacterium]|nr:hypothetical protein [Chloroflexota bacterium]